MYLNSVCAIAGFVARLLVPGREAIDFWWPILLGIAASSAGGFLARALFGSDVHESALQSGGVIYIGAVLILLWSAIIGVGGEFPQKRVRLVDHRLRVGAECGLQVDAL